MASITSFNAVAALKVTNGPNAAGLCSDIGSESSVGVQGDGLNGLNIKVTRNDGKGPQWKGTLPTNARNQSEWIANLTCESLGSLVGTGEHTGDPEDVA